ncbi:actin-like ATPase domain-containing protein [Peniophora sp. CONT]|nr:actin-like ATPase domain-containing protein [Peniophora sp. CONT]
MPRGIPNVKRDETVGMKHSLFNVPLPLNPKHQGSSYLRSETQTLWARNAMQQRLAAPPPREEGRKGSKVIVIDPGSRSLRIGRASDINPVSVPNCIARRTEGPITAPRYLETLKRPTLPNDPPVEWPYEVVMDILYSILRNRMEFYKLRVTPDAGSKASAFNAQSQPEIIPDDNDPFHIDFIMDPPGKDTLVGEDVLRLADPQKMGYTVRNPIQGNRFNTRDYPNKQMIFDDLDTIISTTLSEKLGIERRDFKNYSVILIIPNFYERSYLHEFAHLLMVTMGFKQMCAQQDALAATYGAGLSTACVVNIGATSVSIACVEDGMVVPETRLHLGFGGDSVTEFLHHLLEKVDFPYKDLDLSRSYDWRVMEELKIKLCTLHEHNVALNLFDFIVRAPGKPAEKYGLRAYDEIIISSMVLFEPRILEHERRKIGVRPIQHPDVVDDVYDTRENLEGYNPELVSNAMIISTKHIIDKHKQKIVAQTAQLQAPVQPTEGSAPPAATSAENGPAEDGTPAAGMDVDAVPDDAINPPALTTPPPTETVEPVHQVDVPFEASQLPLDVAIYNCCRGVENEPRLKKWVSSVLLVGGTSQIPGMSYQIESRLQSIVNNGHTEATRSITVLPVPKDVDPHVLVWKGASVLGKMDGVADLWLTAADWDTLGMRGLRERCFFL